MKRDRKHGIGVALALEGGPLFGIKIWLWIKSLHYAYFTLVDNADFTHVVKKGDVNREVARGWSR